MKYPTGILLLLLLACVYSPSYGQFIHFQMNLKPNISAEVIQDLQFGEYLTNSGIKSVRKGNSKMGIFKIRGLANQNLLISLDPPGELKHNDPNIRQTIPVTISASYTNSNANRIEYSRPFINNRAAFTLGINSGDSDGTNWQSAYIYIFGDVSIGNVSEGTYSGVITLTVEYQ